MKRVFTTIDETIKAWASRHEPEQFDRFRTRGWYGYNTISCVDGVLTSSYNMRIAAHVRHRGRLFTILNDGREPDIAYNNHSWLARKILAGSTIWCRKTYKYVSTGIPARPYVTVPDQRLVLSHDEMRKKSFADGWYIDTWYSLIGDHIRSLEWAADQVDGSARLRSTHEWEQKLRYWDTAMRSFYKYLEVRVPTKLDQALSILSVPAVQEKIARDTETSRKISYGLARYDGLRSKYGWKFMEDIYAGLPKKQRTRMSDEDLDALYDLWKN